MIQCKDCELEAEHLILEQDFKMPCPNCKKYMTSSDVPGFLLIDPAPHQDWRPKDPTLEILLDLKCMLLALIVYKDVPSYVINKCNKNMMDDVMLQSGLKELIQ